MTNWIYKVKGDLIYISNKSEIKSIGKNNEKREKSTWEKILNSLNNYKSRMKQVEIYNTERLSLIKLSCAGYNGKINWHKYPEKLWKKGVTRGN